MKSFENTYDDRDTLDLHLSPEGSYTIFDLPPSALPAAEKIVAGFRERAFRVHLLQGDERPDGMASPYGVWPHPDSEALEMLKRETGLEVTTAEERAAALGQAALRAA
jgi:hypothetical protein